MSIEDDWVLPEIIESSGSKHWFIWCGKWNSKYYPGVHGKVEIKLLENPKEGDRFYESYAFVTYSTDQYRVPICVTIHEDYTHLTVYINYDGFEILCKGKYGISTKKKVPKVTATYKCRSHHDAGSIKIYNFPE